jgi:acetyl-CoA C-acetyltransferase
MPEAVIVATARSPIGRAMKGSFVNERADDMAAFIVDAALKKVPELDRTTVDDLMLGCGLPGGEQGFNMGRVVAILADMPQVPGCTITRYCSSSLQTLRMAAHAIRAGEGDAFIAAGVEAVSGFLRGGSSDHTPNTSNPRFADSALRSLARANGDQGDWAPAAGLPDVYIAMGETAENVAEVEGVTREEMDAFALQSHERAARSTDDGFFPGEIVPVPIKDENGQVTDKTLTADEGIRRETTLERLASLPAAWESDDQPAPNITAGNSSQMTDGASAMLIAERSVAERLGLPIRARFAHFAVAAEDPVLVLSAPVPVTYKLMERSGMKPGEWDAVECNEAFASIALMWQKEFDYPMEQFNPRGGAIGIGHPLGASGVALMTRLLRHLEATEGRYGFQTMCEGGGQANGTVIERHS